MKHGRKEYDTIQDNVVAVALAELVLTMNYETQKFHLAKCLAEKILGKVKTRPSLAAKRVLEGLVPKIPDDEPVFLIRAQDLAGGDSVRAWANLAESYSADKDITAAARKYAKKFDKWPNRKLPDL